jgi:hypothetical protein
MESTTYRSIASPESGVVCHCGLPATIEQTIFRCGSCVEYALCAGTVSMNRQCDLYAFRVVSSMAPEYQTQMMWSEVKRCVYERDVAVNRMAEANVRCHNAIGNGMRAMEEQRLRSLSELTQAKDEQCRIALEEQRAQYTVALERLSAERDQAIEQSCAIRSAVSEAHEATTKAIVKYTGEFNRTTAKLTAERDEAIKKEQEAQSLIRAASTLSTLRINNTDNGTPHYLTVYRIHNWSTLLLFVFEQQQQQQHLMLAAGLTLVCPLALNSHQKR